MLVTAMALGLASESSDAAGDYRFRTLPHVDRSGQRANNAAVEAEVFRTIIHEPGANLIRVHFGVETDLGAGGWLLLTSARDGAWQRFDAASLIQWGSRSAIFNGDVVIVEAYAGPRSAINVAIDQTSIDDFASRRPGGDDGGIASLCGADNRVASTDPRVGRMSSSTCGTGGGCGGCTGWLASNGSVLTAGHCSGFSGGLIEFNIPASTSNGRPVASNPDDQYPVGQTFMLFQDAGIGLDWAVMSVGSNSNTGLQPHLVQGFFHISSIVPASGATIRITGCGVDNTPAGSGGVGAACCDFDDDGDCDSNCNAQSLTLQTSTGPFDQLDGSELEYEVDTMPANSGSPIIREANGYALGIHTRGGCDIIVFGDNGGTWCAHAPLASALQQALGANTAFVDAEPVSSIQTGSVINPARTVMFGGAAVPNGGIVYIVAGNYSAAAGNTGTLGSGNKAMLLRAPLGTVTIGQ